jgi:hypothetical protein
MSVADLLSNASAWISRVSTAAFRCERLRSERSGRVCRDSSAVGGPCRVGIAQRNIRDRARRGRPRQRAKRHETGQRDDHGYQTRQKTPPSSHRRESIVFS